MAISRSLMYARTHSATVACPHIFNRTAPEVIWRDDGLEDSPAMRPVYIQPDGHVAVRNTNTTYPSVLTNRFATKMQTRSGKPYAPVISVKDTLWLCAEFDAESHLCTTLSLQQELVAEQNNIGDDEDGHSLWYDALDPVSGLTDYPSTDDDASDTMEEAATLSKKRWHGIVKNVKNVQGCGGGEKAGENVQEWVVWTLATSASNSELGLLTLSGCQKIKTALGIEMCGIHIKDFSLENIKGREALRTSSSSFPKFERKCSVSTEDELARSPHPMTRTHSTVRVSWVEHLVAKDGDQVAAGV
ncbi:hypothetical protein BD410DRAFT_810138 [Rickenella mellea]|uniref:Uncharacterized protein n=1 Tax=Rickenella mellea TaxID=50990 RepID=A0A4Y7PF94_9AGAM|nr:hypothetical protein BD410DRAFT_810138 [Rickenella mellea]